MCRNEMMARSFEIDADRWLRRRPLWSAALGAKCIYTEAGRRRGAAHLTLAHKRNLRRFWCRKSIDILGAEGSGT